jgi:hypothetical protein
MHGEIIRLINHVQQIETLQWPITMKVDSIIFMEFLWCKFCAVVVDLNSLRGTIKCEGKNVKENVSISSCFVLTKLELCVGLTEKKMTVLRVCVQMPMIQAW